MASSLDSALSGANIDFIEGLYARFLEDPASVDPSWRELFSNGGGGEGQPIVMDRPRNGAVQAQATAQARAASVGRTNGHVAPPAPIAVPTPQPLTEGRLQARVDQLIYAFRLRGHLVAQLDPLGRPRPPLEHIADLGMVQENHFTDEELEKVVDSSGVFEQGSVRLRDLLERLRRTYSTHIGVEYMQMLNSDRRRWLQPTMELCENRVEPAPEEQRVILTKLTYAEGFESFLHTKYVGAKRFSLDGGESLIPMLDAFLEEGGKLGLKEAVIGMAHRGRLNVLTNTLGKSPAQIFKEFDGPDDPREYLDRGDVKYHQGFSSDYTTRGGAKLHLSLAFNPSHLEVVDPVVEGRVRAKQDRYTDLGHSECAALLIHGDAAFIGQGVIAETLNLSNLPGYTTGGTIHVVINNQVGFTTDPEDGRSSIYCTAIAQMLDIPIFHVNGDDPEAGVHVMKLATRYRQRFKTDVVIDFICYRRYGHNEGDEPAFTQPQMYELIRARPTVRKLYGDELVRQGRIAAGEPEAIRERCLKELQEAHARSKASSQFHEPSFLEGLWSKYRGGPDRESPDVDTGVDLAQLQAQLRHLATVPQGFTPHPKIARILEARHAMADGKAPLDWSAGETLAYATLLTQGSPLRLTGQDTERGTFSHRHAVVHDVKTGERYVPLEHVSGTQARCVILNSPLSELGCLGFEFGYSLDFPDGLVVWEAQFGDFANGAQVIIDQFIAAAEDKWRRLSGITLLLPHGYEGQGPEHSSARLERFLQLASEDNIQVCYPSTPGQIFHLLRRQVMRQIRKPLIIMSPKSMLRRPEVVSSLDDLCKGRFQRVLFDRPEIPAERVERLLLCTGKIYYDLVQARDAQQDSVIGIARVEQLYPFPAAELTRLLATYPRLQEILWVQEEPKNMGAWGYMFPRLGKIAATRAQLPPVGFVGRRESASPATGFHEAHVLEQKQIVFQAMNRGQA